MSLFLVILLALDLHMAHDLQDPKGPALRQVNQTLTKFQNEAAIGDGLLGPFEIGVEVALLANISPSVVIAVVVDVGVPVGLATLALELHDIVIEIDGMQVDIST